MDQVSEIREKIDIVSLISEFVPLKKMGRNFKANCPFHSEKTPSFVVSPERQIWHCFGGCGKGGDVYSFLMAYENLEFVEALRMLAKRAGIELRQTARDLGQTSKKDTIYRLNRLACEFYHYVLTKHRVGEKALQFLVEKRGVKPQVIETFMLGFAPGVGNALYRYLVGKKKHEKESLLEAGLATQRAGRFVDFFSERIMFPLVDHRDNVVGFSGRALSDSQMPKYINTRDTLAYQKGSHFFGIHIAKDAIKKENKALIVEGEFDVISLFQEGLTNVVAVKGSALTAEQVKLLSRYAQGVALCFDMDRAGQEAVKRSLPVLEEKNFTITVVPTPSGKDPDEAIRKDPFAFKKAVKHDVGIYDFLFEKVLLEQDRKTVEGKKTIAEELLPVFAAIENEIIKEHYLKKLSQELEISLETLLRQIDKMKKKEITKEVIVPLVKKNKSREEVLEEYLLALLLQADNGKEIEKKIAEMHLDTVFVSHAFQKILDHLQMYFQTHDVFDGKKFLSALAQELLAAFDTGYLLPLPKFSDGKAHQQEVLKVIEELKKIRLRSKMKILTEQIKALEKDGKEQEVEVLRNELSQLISLMQK